MRARLGYKVRFHLGRGRNYMKWQITKDQEPPNYVDPQSFQILMSGCVLKNNKRIATEIHQGKNKKVCAWISCESLELKPQGTMETKGLKITFNPRRSPFWTDGTSDLDGTRYQSILSSGRELFVRKAY